MTEDTTFGFNDEALATRPTVYQPGLFDGQVVMLRSDAKNSRFERVSDPIPVLD